MAVRIGTSGWVYAHWRGRLYPQDLAQRRWLAHYAARFEVVEVNASFYRLPSEETFRAWAAQVPPGFRFAVKGSRFVTHMKRLIAVEDSVALITGRARALGAHLGPILWQLRPDMPLDLGRLRDFLAALPRDLLHVLEARNGTWADERVRDLLRDAGVAFASWDLLDTTWVEEPTTTFTYVRFHGPSQKYGGSYAVEALRPWIRRIERWQADGVDIWAFFNNDLDGHAVEDAARLRSLLAPTPPRRSPRPERPGTGARRRR